MRKLEQVPEELIARFWRQQKLNVETGCIEWLGHIYSDTGYGHAIMRHNGKNYSIGAHVLAKLIEVGEIPDGVCVLHKNSCHNRKCVNPDHLYLGTKKDNAKDMVELGTATTLIMGFSHPSSTLTDKEIEQVRELLSSGWPQDSIARKLAINQSTVSRIKNEKRKRYALCLSNSKEN